MAHRYFYLCVAKCKHIQRASVFDLFFGVVQRQYKGSTKAVQRQYKDSTKTVQATQAVQAPTPAPAPVAKTETETVSVDSKPLTLEQRRLKREALADQFVNPNKPSTYIQKQLDKLKKEQNK